MTTKRESPCYADLYDFFADMTMLCAKELGTRATDYDEPGFAAEEIREAIERIAPGGLFMEKYGHRLCVRNPAPLRPAPTTTENSRG